MSKISIIILAAGLGSRMKGKKMLVPFKGKPMVAHAIEAAFASLAHEVIFVVGHDKEKLITLFPNISMIESVDYKQGLSASLKAGIKAVKGDAALIMLGDMPLVTTKTLNMLIEAFQSDHDIIVPTHKGEIGNPMLWGKAHFEKLLTLEGDKGAKSLLSRLTYKKIEVNDTSIFKDFDTPQDFI